MTAIIKRNLKVFFRDKTSVFFSLLSLMIIIGLYALFLGDMIQAGMEDIPGARFLMDSWIMAGLLAVSSITTTMGAFGIMVDDRSKNILKDFSSSPLSRKSLAAGYILSSFLIGVIISLLAFVIAEGYILAYGGSLLPLTGLLSLLGCILLSVLASSAIVFFITSFFKSQNAFATGSTIIGTLVGFLTGIYIPIGNLPAAVQVVIKAFPVSHAGVLFRQIMMEVPLREAFEHAPPGSLEKFQQELGVVFTFGDHTITALTSVLVLVGTAILFYGLAIWNLSRKSR